MKMTALSSVTFGIVVKHPKRRIQDLEHAIDQWAYILLRLLRHTLFALHIVESKILNR